MASNAHDRGRQALGMSRRQFLRRLTGGGAVAIAGQVLAACGDDTAATAPTPAPASATSAPAASGAATKLTLMIGEAEFSDDQIKAFTDAHPGISIERAPDDEAQFKASLEAGTPPDLIRTDGFRLANLAQRGVLLDLTDYFNASTLIKKDDLAPPNDYYHYQGRIYGMPKDWSPDYSLFVSSAAFEQADLPLPSTTKALTYPELRDLARKLTKRDGDKVTQMGYGYSFSTFARIVQGLLVQRGEKLYKPDFSAIVLQENPAAIEILRYFYDISKENVTWNPLSPSPSWAGEDFLKGILGICQLGYWYSAMITANNETLEKQRPVLLPAPSWDGKQRFNPTAAAVGLVVAKSAKNPDAAWQLFEYYMAGSPAKARAASGWGVPALKSLYPLMPRGSAFQRQVQEQLSDELQYADRMLDANPNYDDSVFSNSWMSNLDKALRGAISFEQLVAAVERDCNEAISAGMTK
ncbi:MAG TPA: extracellular solute-binding protein [Roseiflexaceae bacterium]|nr:extracellular solute-binding protein [Roseiflexaceae bacterium]